MTLLLALMTAPAMAWTILQNGDGSELRWTQMPIPYAINPGNAQGLTISEVMGAVSGAMGAWSSIDGASVEFSDQGQTPIQAVDYDEVNTIYFESEWTMDPELMAITANWSYSDGTIVGFDIRINERDHKWSTGGTMDADDLQNMLTHEVGHGLGLDHTTLDDAATMFANAIPGETTKREPKSDDRQGVQYLYGEGTAMDASEEAAGGCSSSGLAPRGTAVFLLAGVMLGWRRADP